MKMLMVLWLKGIVKSRSGRLLGAAMGVALTVALLALLAGFITSSAASMTERAIKDVPVDWQVQLSPGSDPASIIGTIGRTTGYEALEVVGYADTSGFSSTVNGTTQTTGPGKVLGISEQYRHAFPAELRSLIGSLDGVLVAQQTAANLHVTVGDTIVIKRVGLPAATVQVDGVVDLPQSDSLFQAVGLPQGAAPQAPPDNVLLLPSSKWHQLFDQQASVHPDSVRTQLHIRLAHNLPSSPDAAFGYVESLARNLEARIAGSGVVGNNLAAQLDGTRQDALYAQVLFLFLGLPGVVVAVLLTLGVAGSGGERRRREQALLRVRGASTSQVMLLQGLESIVIGVGGVTLGLLIALAGARILFPGDVLFNADTIYWTGATALAGLMLAAASILYPAWQQARRSTVVASRAPIGPASQPIWQKIYLDLILLAASALALWQSMSTGYQVVLAPEGIPQSSIAYETFIAPACLWLGVGLLSVRIWRRFLGHNTGRRLLAVILRPVARKLSGVVSASLGRQRSLLVRGLILVTLAFSFATSTAVFNTTYNAQSRVDAELTNGADVAVTGSAASAPGAKLAEFRALQGVAGIQAMQHRFAYVGNDLQDLYGIDPLHIGEATEMSPAYFAGGKPIDTLKALAKQRDGVLVSEETIKDFQLSTGDLINLRLQNSSDHLYHVVPFHVVGIVREFPTAPKDSFLVANASYVAEMTGTSSAEVVLMRASGNVATLAAKVRQFAGNMPGVHVTDIGATQQTIGSSLTAVDLRGLTTLELVFAVLMLIGVTGLVTALGLAERRRTFSILSALGAKSNQLGSFLWSEGLLILLGGGVIGLVLGIGVAQILVTVLTGVFDPPPESLSVPWTYLGLLVVSATASTVLAVLAAHVTSRQEVVSTLRGF